MEQRMYLLIDFKQQLTIQVIGREENITLFLITAKISLEQLVARNQWQTKNGLYIENKMNASFSNFDKNSLIN